MNVVHHFEVASLELEDIVDAFVDEQHRYGMWFTRQLQIDLIQVVAVDVNITAGPHEVASRVAGYVGDHFGQQRIAGDVERHAEEYVTGRTFVRSR